MHDSVMIRFCPLTGRDRAAIRRILRRQIIRFAQNVLAMAKRAVHVAVKAIVLPVNPKVIAKIDSNFGDMQRVKREYQTNNDPRR